MNCDKTEVMKVGKERGHCCVEVRDRKLKSVEVFDDKWGWWDVE